MTRAAQAPERLLPTHDDMIMLALGARTSLARQAMASGAISINTPTIEAHRAMSTTMSEARLTHHSRRGHGGRPAQMKAAVIRKASAITPQSTPSARSVVGFDTVQLPGS